MKKATLLLFMSCSLIATFIFTSGCTEETEIPVKSDSITRWVMNYNEGTVLGNFTYYREDQFIKNGIATYPANLYHKEQDWYTGYELAVPSYIKLDVDKDTVLLVARLKNPDGDKTGHEMSMVLVYNSMTDAKAVAVFQMGSNSNGCLLGITHQTINNVTQQLTDANDFAEYGISVKGKKVFSHKNNFVSSLKSADYTGTMGTLKKIRIGFRGYGQIDWVKLYKGGRLVMVEEFNTDGTSTPVWTKP